jgi:predicted methyltransferase
VFGVIDENGEAGADNQVIGQKLHRADPAAMIKDLLAAGFEFEGQSDLLANAEDYKTTSVFLPVNR